MSNAGAGVGGSSGSGGTGGIGAELDDVRIYARVLSAAEIVQVMNGS